MDIWVRAMKKRTAQMVGFLQAIIPFQYKCLSSQIHAFSLARFFHYRLDGGFCQETEGLCSTQKTIENSVAILWDLDNKPPNSFPPYDAAVRLKIAASAFGVVHYMVAYANHRSFSYVPPAIRDQRNETKALNQLEAKGVIKPSEPCCCRICGRKFYTNEKLINHFKQLHEREQINRMNRLESARGKQQVQLMGKFSMKMEKYKKAASGILTPKVGYGLADELKRAGFRVCTVSDRPQAAVSALRNHMVEMMDRRIVGCFVLVSDDSDFVNVLREAKLRCLRTVVMSDKKDGALRRCADAGFSWTEVASGKANKEAKSVVGRWKDRDILKRLEWSYRPEAEKSEIDACNGEEAIEDFTCEDEDSLLFKDDTGSWWELESDMEGTQIQSNDR